MVVSNQLIGDAVGSILEKVLMDAGVTKYGQITDILVDHDMAFSDCYRRPDVLNFALKETFGYEYLTIVEKIRTEVTGLDEDNKINSFLEQISESKNN